MLRQRPRVMTIVCAFALAGCAKVNHRNPDQSNVSDGGQVDEPGVAGAAAIGSGIGGEHAVLGAGRGASGRGGSGAAASSGAMAAGRSAAAGHAANGGGFAAGGTSGVAAGNAGSSGNSGTSGAAGSGSGCAADDAACTPAAGVLGYCKAGSCVSCAGGSASHVSCSTAYGNGAGYVCASGNCVAGQCVTNGECSGGQLCGIGAAYQCGNCSADSACTSEGGFGPGYLCISGACVVADCRTDSDCQAGQICGLRSPNQCGDCASDEQCHNDTVSYGTTFVCATSTSRCVPASCSPDHQACSANAADYCCGGACVAGNCCSSADCVGLGSQFFCTNHTCTQCAPVTNHTFYVDPAGGSDTLGTGNTSTAGCAFKTIARALAVIGAAADPGTKVMVLPTAAIGTATNGEQFPLDVPSNVVIGGSGGRVQVLVPASTNGFYLHRPGSGLSNLTIDGQNHVAAYGVYVTTGADANLASLDVQNMGGDGIRVVGSGQLNVLAGVHSSSNGTTNSPADGLYVSGQGHVKINVSSSDAVHFDHNTAHGIYVNQAGSIELTGTPSVNGAGTVTTNWNTLAGVWIEQTPSGSVPVNAITGLVAWANSSSGLRVMGGSVVTVRQSVLLANAGSGVQVSTYVNGTTRNNDTSRINLGTVGASTYGGNTLQSAFGSNPNGGAGVCLAVDRTAGAVLNAAGNAFAGPTDCTTSTATLRKSRRCSGSVDYGVRSTGSTTNSIIIANCH